MGILFVELNNTEYHSENEIPNEPLKKTVSMAIKCNMVK